VTATSGPRIALLSYSTKPRGGVVHTLSLAEAMTARGINVHVISLGDASKGFFRDVAAPFTLIPAPDKLPTLEERVFASIDALEGGLRSLVGGFDILHTQDCISARAAARIRDAGAPVTVVRTVHHIDDFTTPALINCQRQAVLEPDSLVVVSEHWRTLLRRDNGVEARVIHNGVDASRFGPVPQRACDEIRQRTGVTNRFVFLAVGGIEPRKGSVHLIRALAALRRQGLDPAVVIVGGHSFQDYQQYRDDALELIDQLGLSRDRDVIEVGTVTDEELHTWYRAADALVFPSINEGWGLAVLEAMAAQLPVVASDIPVLREYLTDGVNAVLTVTADADDLARGMKTVMDDAELRRTLTKAGTDLVEQFTWDGAAAQHEELYESLITQRRT
jgi:glycosyltransferase-like protein